MLKKFFLSLITIIYFASIIEGVYANPASKQVVMDIKEGSLKLEDLLSACKEIAQSKSSKFVGKEISGKVIEIGEKQYEVRFFSFEDTSGKLPKDMTFKEYAINKNLLQMHSSVMEPLPGIHFESFDYRKMKLDDGVYFSMAIRLIIK
jgi:hypothetical protein